MVVRKSAKLSADEKRHATAHEDEHERTHMMTSEDVRRHALADTWGHPSSLVFTRHRPCSLGVGRLHSASLGRRSASLGGGVLTTFCDHTAATLVKDPVSQARSA